MSHNWEVGSGMECWERISVTVDDNHDNRINCANHAANSSDNSINHTGCRVPNTQKSMLKRQITTAARQAKAENFSFLGWIFRRTTQGWSPFDQKSCE